MTAHPANSVAWFEIPVTDLGKATAFYGTVTGFPLTMEKMGPMEMAYFAYERGGMNVSGHLIEGTPAAANTGARIHLYVAGTVEQAADRVKTAGGQVVSPVFDIPTGRYANCLDPDGNAFGIYTSAA